MLPTARLVVATRSVPGGGVDVVDVPDTKPAQPPKRAKVSDSMIATAEPTQPDGERIQSAIFAAQSIRRGRVKSGAEHILDVRLLANRQACAHRLRAIIMVSLPMVRPRP
jgi:hypothetical protein